MPDLTPDERSKLLSCLCQGLSAQQIAAQLGLSEPELRALVRQMLTELVADENTPKGRTGTRSQS